MKLICIENAKVTQAKALDRPDQSLYNAGMSHFNLYHPIEVRYSDLDPQWHVNNARLVSFLELARFAYIRRLNIWDGKSFFELPLIVADVHVAYLAPVFLGQPVRVGVRVSRIGNKSLTFEYQIEDSSTGQALAKAETVMVAYDYNQHTSIPVPQEWREKINAFEENT